MATLLLTFSGKLLSLKRVLNANTVSNLPINKQVKNLHLFVFCTKKKFVKLVLHIHIHFNNCISSNKHMPGAYLKFQIKGGALIGRLRTFNRGRALVRNLLTCTNSTVAEA